MARLGDTVFLVCRSKSEEKLRIKGVVVEVDSEDLVVGIAVDLARELSASVIHEKTDGPSFGFVKIPSSSVSTVQPAGWGGRTGGKPPVYEKALEAWTVLAKKVELGSSEAEPVEDRTAGGRSQASKEKRVKGFEEQLLQMKEELWAQEESENSSSSESDSEEEEKSGRKHLPPGVSSLRKKEKKEHKDRSSRDPMEKMQELMMDSMAKGSSSSDMMPLVMMSMMMNQNSRSRRRRRNRRRSGDALGGSSSDDSSGSGSGGRDVGMKAVTSLHRLQKRIRRHPKRVIREFEDSMVRELGVVEGQSWSVVEWLKKQQWGKFRGLYRATIMDSAAYELARAGDAQGAAAQLAQNMKSKLQCVLDGGDWRSAWLLTGIEDPISKREFAGSKSEMAVIANYVNSLHKLRKKVKEAGAVKEEDQD